MTYTTFRNPCTLPTASIVVLTSFVQAREYAQSHPALIETEFEAESEQEARSFAYYEWQDTRDAYLGMLEGDIY